MATFRCIFIPSKKYGGWHGPQVVPCSQPAENMPDIEEMKRVITNFLKPPATVTETVEETEVNDRAR
jgi:hypothetical protein